jgi:hypothetical protein
MTLLRDHYPIGSDRSELDSSTHLYCGPMLHTIARGDFQVLDGRSGCEAGLVLVCQMRVYQLAANVATPVG